MRLRKLKSLGGLKKTRKVEGSKRIYEDKKAKDAGKIKDDKIGQGVQEDK
jgi:hypothetical protein